MNKRYGHVTMTLLLVAALLLNICLVNVSLVHATDIPRDEIIWATGYWPPETYFNPVTQLEGAMGWDPILMYEPLFGFDAASLSIIKELGKSIDWINDGRAIKITLRPDVYWVKITDWDAWHAASPGSTAGVEVNETITADDVIYSFWLYGAFPDSPEQAYYMSSLKTRIDHYEKVDNQTIIFYLASDVCSYNTIVWRTLTRSYPILPWKVWKSIYDAGGGWGAINDFANDWTASGFPADYRVASGMYLPWEHDPEGKWTIMKRNPLWWGINSAPVPGFQTGGGRRPAPNYFGYRGGNYYGTNEAIYGDLRDGMLDWDGNYVPPDVWARAEQPAGSGNYFLKTYFTYPPYFPEGSTLLMVPNHRKYPLSESWLRKAITMVINYSAVNEASSGYLFDPSPLLLPWTDAAARELCPVANPIEEAAVLQYGTYSTKDIAKYKAAALQIMNTACYEKGGVWYTRDNVDTTVSISITFDTDTVVNFGPYVTKTYPAGTIIKFDVKIVMNEDARTAWAQNLMDYYGDINLIVGETTKLASAWISGGFADADQDPDTPGVNLKIGTWGILDIEGWSDVNAIDLAVIASVNGAFGKEILKADFTDWGGYTGDTGMNGNAYDFADFCMHAGINNNLYERYTQLFVGTYSGTWNHYGSYVNTELIELIESLANVPPGPQQQAIADRIQEIVCEELPIIPEGGHPVWYIYSELYWCRWPNQFHVLLPVGPYCGSGQSHIRYLVSTLGSVNCPQDLNNDHKVDGKDVRTAQKAFGSYPGHPRWEYVADIMPVTTYNVYGYPKVYRGDGKVDGKDVRDICKAYGKTW